MTKHHGRTGRSAPPGVAMTSTEQISNTIIGHAADLLQQAGRTRQPTAPIRALIGADNIGAAYAIQQELIARRVAEGAVIVGRKIGLTSPAVQQQLGVDQPDFGMLLADMDISGEPVIRSHRLIQPKVEAEIAFVLNADFAGEISDPEQIRAAVDYAVGAIEIVDSRMTDWDLTIADTIADNASSGLFVLG